MTDTNKMRDPVREQFEAWHRSVVEGEPPHEKYSDGSYVNPHVNRYWTGWQASRQAVVIVIDVKDGEVSVPDIEACAIGQGLRVDVRT